MFSSRNDDYSDESPTHPPSPAPTPPPLHARSAPHSILAHPEDEPIPGFRRALGVVSIHSSSLSGLLQRAHGPWYSCVIQADEKLRRTDASGKVYSGGVLEFLAHLEEDAKAYSLGSEDTTATSMLSSLESIGEPEDSAMSDAPAEDGQQPGVAQSNVWL
jgi:hypothetical protein